MSDTDGLIIGADGAPRCWWCGSAPDYVAYHDHEWGRPARDDARLFEKVVLEGFQAGLSWLTILRKRENFRAAFDGFEIDRVAGYGPEQVTRLLADPGIVRHRGKIEAAISNAAAARRLRDETGSLAAYFERFRPDGSERPDRIWKHSVPAETPTSRALSKDLKARGWRFVGPTTMYAFMQAMGLVNDHIDGCAFRDRGPRD